MLRTEKILQLRSQHGRNLRIVREHYLRDDVPCHSNLCLSDCNEYDKTLIRLESDTTHYVVPDCQVGRDYLEVLEIPEVTGIIFLYTVAHSIQHEGGRRQFRRLNKMLKDPRKKSVLFCNEFQRYAYQPREKGEQLQDWQERSIYKAVEWFHNHLAGQMPIVIISENPEMKEKYIGKTRDVFVLDFSEYLSTFWPDLSAAADLYESLEAALKDSKIKGHDYEGYLPQEVLDSGIKSGSFVQGRLNVNKHNAMHEATVTPLGVSTKKGDKESDVLIPGMSARNRAVHGDMVVVELLPKSQWQARSTALREVETAKDGESEDQEHTTQGGPPMPTGKVVGVLQRNWRDYVASFAVDQESQSQRRIDKVLVIPFDIRVPKIRVSTSHVEALKEHRIIVRIDSWELGSQYPNGHFVSDLGLIGELETEIQVILIENDISVLPFSEGQLKELPTNTWEKPWEMTEAEIKKRRDLRKSHLIFSIDPRGCEDVDDTLSIRKLENGHTELGVHIADVTYFVPPGSLSNLEARSRSTTVYLADRRFDMLPAILSADLCSLLSGVDRYAMSVIWELDHKYKVVDVWYGRTVIRSQYKLFYEIAQELAEGAGIGKLVKNIPELQPLPDNEVQDRIIELRWAVTALMDVARHIKGRRMLGGALELEGVEVQVQINKENATIEDLIPKQPLEIHETIAECMIFANHWVAKKIAQAFPEQSLLRHHPLPRQEHFQMLYLCAKAKKFSIDTTSNRKLAESLNACIDKNDPVVNKLLRSLATQAMSNAAYFSTGSLSRDQYFHYGLALDFYTHFTSPIRRYADVLVHRLLMAALQPADNKSLFNNKELQELAEHINTKHRAAQHAQRTSVELFQMLFFKELTSRGEECLADASILQIRANGLLVFVPRYGMKGAVYLKDKMGAVVYIHKTGRVEWTSGSLNRGDQDITVNSSFGSHTYTLLDHITVQISVRASRVHSSSLKLEIVSNSGYIADGCNISDSNQQKAEIIKAVTATAAEDSKQDDDLEDVRLGSLFSEHKSLYGQSPDGTTLYDLFLALERTALSDL